MRIIYNILLGGTLYTLYNLLSNNIKDLSLNEGIIMAGIVIIACLTGIYIYNSYMRDQRKKSESSAKERLASIDDVIISHYLNGRRMTPEEDNTEIHDNNNSTNDDMENTNNQNQNAMTNDRESEVKETIESIEPKHIGTRDLLFDTLTKLGCQWNIDEENDGIRFTYQGGHFLIYAINESPFITIYYPFWNEVELYDIDNLSRWKKAINQSNCNTGVTTFYAINEAGGQMYVHSKTKLIFIKEMPYLENLLNTILGEFFEVQRNVTNEVYRLKVEEEGGK